MHDDNLAIIRICNDCKKTFITQSSIEEHIKTTGQRVFDSHNDFIQFLEFTRENYRGKMHTRIRLTKLTYDYKRDLRIIRMNSTILYLFHAKKIMIRNHSEPERKLGYYMLDDWTLNDVFKYDSNAATPNTLRKFTI